MYPRISRLHYIFFKSDVFSQKLSSKEGSYQYSVNSAFSTLASMGQSGESKNLFVFNLGLRRAAGA